jgi:hypothetical protein
MLVTRAEVKIYIDNEASALARDALTTPFHRANMKPPGPGKPKQSAPMCESVLANAAELSSTYVALPLGRCVG